MPTANNEQARQTTTCPKCNAAPGQPCVNTDTKLHLNNLVHAKRLVEADRRLMEREEAETQDKPAPRTYRVLVPMPPAATRVAKVLAQFGDTPALSDDIELLIRLTEPAEGEYELAGIVRDLQDRLNALTVYGSPIKLAKPTLVEPPAKPEKSSWASTLSYAATALEASSDNGDRYAAKQIRDHLAAAGHDEDWYESLEDTMRSTGVTAWTRPWTGPTPPVDPISIVCPNPFCPAGEGQPCQDGAGSIKARAHRSRREAWEKLQDHPMDRPESPYANIPTKDPLTLRTIDVACPSAYCDAQPGDKCRDVAGERSFHLARINAAKVAKP
jgi:hypothetical protein